MKSTLSANRTWFMSVGLATAVLGAMWWLPDHAGRDAEYGRDGAAAQRDGLDPGTTAERPVRRLRASSTMPYFSFAQSLRSRG